MSHALTPRGAGEGGLRDVIRPGETACGGRLSMSCRLRAHGILCGGAAGALDSLDAEQIGAASGPQLSGLCSAVVAVVLVASMWPWPDEGRGNQAPAGNSRGGQALSNPVTTGIRRSTRRASCGWPEQLPDDHPPNCALPQAARGARCTSVERMLEYYRQA